MKTKSESDPQSIYRPFQLGLTRCFLGFATGIACYLAWVSLRGIGVLGCGSGSGCRELLSGRWAYWFGIPVSIPALAIYVSMFGATFFLSPSQPFLRQRAARSLLVSLSILVIGAALWFSILQVFVIKRFCPFCLTAHALATAAALVLFMAR